MSRFYPIIVQTATYRTVSLRISIASVLATPTDNPDLNGHVLF